MKILDWINKLFRRNNIKELDVPKNIEDNDWKKGLQCQSNIDVVDNNSTEEQMRIEQIKATSFMILFKEDHLLREDIIKRLEGKFGNVILNDEDIHSLIAIHDVIEYEDLHAENNIRDFIDDDENNMIRLVDKLTEYAKEEAKKYESEDYWQFIPNDVKVVDRLKNEIKNELENENEEYREGE